MVRPTDTHYNQCVNSIWWAEEKLRCVFLAEQKFHILVPWENA